MVSHVIHAGQRDINLDSVVSRSIATADANFFTNSASEPDGADQPAAFGVMKVSEAEFPALNGQGVSYAVLQFPMGSLNPPHRHPESAELLFLLTGSLEVGLIGANNVLRSQTLEAADVFVFPKGVVHYQYNYGQDSAFGDADVQTIHSPGSILSTLVRDDNIAKSFKIHARFEADIRTSNL